MTETTTAGEQNIADTLSTLADFIEQQDFTSEEQDRAVRTTADALPELQAAGADVLHELDTEIEQRKQSGDEKYWNGLERKTDRLRNALAALS